MTEAVTEISVVSSTFGTMATAELSMTTMFVGGDGSGIPGPTGPPGKDGQIRFTGIGPPGVIVGAEPQDTYTDLATGDVYKLL